MEIAQIGSILNIASYLYKEIVQAQPLLFDEQLHMLEFLILKQYLYQTNKQKISLAFTKRTRNSYFLDYSKLGRVAKYRQLKSIITVQEEIEIQFNSVSLVIYQPILPGL